MGKSVLDGSKSRPENILEFESDVFGGDGWKVDGKVVCHVNNLCQICNVNNKEGHKIAGL